MTGNATQSRRIFIMHFSPQQPAPPGIHFCRRDASVRNPTALSDCRQILHRNKSQYAGTREPSDTNIEKPI